jgi:hypothetical protein
LFVFLLSGQKKAIMGFYLFRTPKPRRFNHVPIYYNESKERLEEMKKNALFEAGKLPSEEYKPNFKGKFRRGWYQTPYEAGKAETRKSNLRLVLIIGILLFAAYLILNVDGNFINVFYK